MSESTVFPMKLNFLPDEVIFEILSWLSKFELLKSRRISSRFVFLIDHSKNLWTKFPLQLSYKVNGNSSYFQIKNTSNLHPHKLFKFLESRSGNLIKSVTLSFRPSFAYPIYQDYPSDKQSEFSWCPIKELQTALCKFISNQKVLVTFDASKAVIGTNTLKALLSSRSLKCFSLMGLMYEDGYFQTAKDVNDLLASNQSSLEEFHYHHNEEYGFFRYFSLVSSSWTRLSTLHLYFTNKDKFTDTHIDILTNSFVQLSNLGQLVKLGIHCEESTSKSKNMIKVLKVVLEPFLIKALPRLEEFEFEFRGFRDVNLLLRIVYTYGYNLRRISVKLSKPRDIETDLLWEMAECNFLREFNDFGSQQPNFGVEKKWSSIISTDYQRF